MNIPNILTLIRLILVPLFPLVFFSEMHNAILISFIIFLAAGLTDVLDGYIARKYNMITKWGTMLDPFADKLMSLTVLLSLTVKEYIPLWVIMIIGSKELFMMIGAAILFNKGTFVPAKIYGKTATVLLYISVAMLEIVSRSIGLIFIYITVFVTLYAFYKYIENYSKMQKMNKN